MMLQAVIKASFHVKYIYSLGGGARTHTHTHTHTHSLGTKAISGLKITLKVVKCN